MNFFKWLFKKLFIKKCCQQQRKKRKMKKIIIIIALASIAIAACNNSSKQPETTVTDNPNQLYACSMHPEVIGKTDSACSKCGMKLTEPVKEKK